MGRPSEESQGFKPDPGNLAVRDYRGASGNVSHGETVNPSCNRKSRNGNPSPTAGRARFLSQWSYNRLNREVDRRQEGGGRVRSRRSGVTPTERGGPPVCNVSFNREGKDEMTKASEQPARLQI